MKYKEFEFKDYDFMRMTLKYFLENRFQQAIRGIEDLNYIMFRRGNKWILKMRYHQGDSLM